jgi:hypothetical protein
MIPLVAKDSVGERIDPVGETVILLAYGVNNDPSKLRHKFRTSVRIYLSTGNSIG